MTQEERRIWLIKALQKEMPEYAGYRIPILFLLFLLFYYILCKR